MHGRHVMNSLTWAVGDVIVIVTWLNSRFLLLETTIPQVLLELPLLESVKQRVLLESIGEVVQHDDLVAHSTELDCVTNA